MKRIRKGIATALVLAACLAAAPQDAQAATNEQPAYVQAYDWIMQSVGGAATWFYCDLLGIKAACP